MSVQFISHSGFGLLPVFNRKSMLLLLKPLWATKHHRSDIR